MHQQRPAAAAEGATYTHAQPMQAKHSSQTLPVTPAQQQIQAVQQNLKNIVKLANQMITNEQAGTDCESKDVGSTAIETALQEITLQSIERAISNAESFNYFDMPESISIHTIFSQPNSPPVFQLPNDNRPYICIKANGVDCVPLLDSGAMVCIVIYQDEEELTKFGARIEPCTTKISTITTNDTKCTGFMRIVYEYCDQKREIPTLLFKGNRSQFIVGINFWQAFGIRFAWEREVSKEEKGIEKSSSTTEPIVQADTIEIQALDGVNETNKQSTCNASGIFRVTTNTSRRKSIQKYVPKWQSNGKIQAALKISHENNFEKRIKPVYTTYESSNNSIQSAPLSTTVQSVSQTPVSKNSTASKNELPTQAILKMLSEMPTFAAINEIAIQPSIRTADGAGDTVNDVTPEKHSCVSVPHKLTPSQREKLQAVLSEFPYTPETGPLNVTNVYTQSINTGDAVPQMRKQYPLSPYVLAEVEKEIEKLIERDIIQPIDFSPWRWPILWVKKKTGGGRICVDARGLNKVTIPDAYPTLNVDTILRNLPQAKYISCLDMTQAFHQIEINPSDRIKTSFAVGHRFYCFKRAIMGFINSPADLAKMLDRVFGDLMPRVYHYVDDFVILSSTFEEHIELLREVARRLKEANLTISKEKSTFCHSRVTFLGYVLTKEGLEANPERIQPILDYPRPRTVKEVRRLVGLVGWYRRFLPNAAELLAPLSDLMKGESNAAIKWNDQAEEAFVAVKKALISTSILASPDYKLPFKIYTDASLVAGAAILTQVQSGQERVIAYHSVKFSQTQRNYSATERECLAVISGVEKFRPYVDGVPFTVVTDHSSLRWLQNLKEPHGKLARWAVRLQAFDITFEHRPGKQMAAPDALSRAIEMIEIESQAKTEDTWYQKMFDLTQKNKTDRFKIENGILYRRGKFDIGSGDRLWLVCVPKEKIAAVLQEKHDDQSHVGFWKTLKSIQKVYYWPELNRHVYKHVHECISCKQIKPSTEHTIVPTGKYRNPKTVGRVISLDLVGPLPPSRMVKHTWLMVAVDAFSRYVFAKSCVRATAQAITDWIEKEIFFKFDIPEIMITDNGTQFTSEWFKHFLQAYKVKHETTPVYHPQANQVEATNKSLKQLLRAELLEKSDHADWANYVHKVVMRLNTIPRMPTGYSPYYIVYGREKHMTGNEHSVLTDANPQPDNLHEKRQAIYEKAAEEQRAAFEQNRRKHDMRARERKFKPGDIVLVRIHKQSSASDKYTQKLAPIKKRAIVKEAVGSDTYLLMDWQQNDIGKHHANDIFRQ